MLEHPTKDRKSELSVELSTNPRQKFDLKFQTSESLSDFEEMMIIFGSKRAGDRITIPEEKLPLIMGDAFSSLQNGQLEDIFKSVINLGIKPEVMYKLFFEHFDELLYKSSSEIIPHFILYFLDNNIDMDGIIELAKGNEFLIEIILENASRFAIQLPFRDFYYSLLNVSNGVDLLFKYSQLFKSNGVTLDIMDLFNRSSAPHSIFATHYEVLYDAGMDQDTFLQYSRNLQGEAVTSFILKSDFDFKKLLDTDPELFRDIFNSTSFDNLLSKGITAKEMFEKLFQHESCIGYILSNYSFFKENIEDFNEREFFKKILFEHDSSRYVIKYLLVETCINSLNQEDLIRVWNGFLIEKFEDTLVIAAIKRLLNMGTNMKNEVLQAIEGKGMAVQDPMIQAKFLAIFGIKGREMFDLLCVNNYRLQSWDVSFLFDYGIGVNEFIDKIKSLPDGGEYLTNDLLKKLEVKDEYVPWKEIFSLYVKANIRITHPKDLMYFINKVPGEFIYHELDNLNFVVQLHGALVTDLILSASNPNELMDTMFKTYPRISLDYPRLIENPKVNAEQVYAHMLHTGKIFTIMEFVHLFESRGLRIDLKNREGDLVSNFTYTARHAEPQVIENFTRVNIDIDNLFNAIIMASELPTMLKVGEVFKGKVNNVKELFQRSGFQLVLSHGVAILILFYDLGIRGIDTDRFYPEVKKEIDLLFTVQDIDKLKVLLGLGLVSRDDARFKAMESVTQVQLGELNGDNNLEQREHFGEVDVPNLAAEFYLYQSIKERISLIEESYNYSNVESGVRMEFERIKRRTQYCEQRVFAFLQEYTLYAVCSELGHARPQNGISYTTYYYNPKTLWENSSREELLNFYNTASRLFCLSIFPGAFYGGPKWAEIARAGYDLMYAKKANPLLCDIMFSLEHNSGDFFDKDSSRIKRDSGKLKDLLDAKFAAPGPKELRDSMINFVDPGNMQAHKDSILVEKIASAYRV